jgi:hypothetical protein
MSKTISGLPLAETLTGNELLPVVQDGNTVQSTVQQVVNLVGNTATWGDIHGTLSNQTDLQTALDGKYSTSNPAGYITASALTGYAPLNSPTFTGTVGGITKSMVGLGNVDNTADANKSVNYANTAGSASNSDTVDGYHIQVDGTGTNPNTIYFKTTGGVDPGAAIWGDITGSIVDQTDLYNALVNGTYATGNWNINASSVDGYSVQVDGTGTDPNTIYFKTTGGTISVDWDDVSNTPTTVAGYGITDAVTTSGNQTVGGTKTFSSTITGSITGNAGTVTNGVYTTGNQTVGGTKTFSSTISGSIDGNSNTVDGYHVQVDGTGTDPNTIYFKTTGGTTSVEWGDISGTLSDQTDLQTALNGKVPYTGATGNVNLGEYGLTSGFLQADLTPTNALQVGRMQWNDADGTMDLRLKGNNVTLQIGQEQLIRVVNKTGADLLEANYQCVKISGAQGQRPKVALAQANNDANSADTIGLVTETIANNQEGFVTDSGIVSNINTTGSLQGETWADGDVLYLSGTTAGRLTNIKPQAPIHTVIVGFVIYAHNNQGKIYVKVDNGYELNELHNVRINGVTDGQVLAYDSTLSVWENINQSAITSGNSDKVDGYHVQVDGTGTDPNTIYFKTTGGSIGVDWDDISNTPTTVAGYGITDAVTTSGNQTIGGTKTFSSTITGSITGNAGTVTNGVYTTGDQTIGGNKNFSSTIIGSVSGNAGTVTNGVYITGDQTIGGAKTFSTAPNAPTLAVGTNNTSVATTAFVNAEIANDAPSKTGTGASGTWGISVTGNAGTVTNGVYTTGDQTIAGIKTFSGASTIVGGNFNLSGGTANGVAYLNGSKNLTTGSALTFNGSGLGIGTSAVTGVSLLDVETGSGRIQLRSGANTGGTGSGTGIVSINSSVNAIIDLNYRATNHAWVVNSSEAMRLTSTGLGIGTTSPAHKLTVNGTIYSEQNGTNAILNAFLANNKYIDFQWYGSSIGGIGQNGASVQYSANLNHQFFVNGTNRATLASTGFSINTDVLAPIYYDSANTAYYLDPANTGTSLLVAGSVGIGTTAPASKLHIDVDGTALRITRGSSIGFLYNTGTASTDITRLQSNGGSVQLYTTGGTATLDASGNLGVGVTPSAWVGYKAVDLNTGGLSLAGGNQSGSVGVGAYWDNVGATWKYSLTTSYRPVRIDMFDGAFGFNIASAGGTAGNAISFTQAMTLDANGNLGIGTTSVSSIGGSITTVDISGSAGGGIRFQRTASTATNAYVTALSGEFRIATADTNPLTFGTNNTERMRITSAGNVGIGTSSPHGKLHVVSGTNDTLLIRGPINYATGASIYAVNSANSVITPMELCASQFFLTGGNVGIGVVSPSNKLEVGGSILASGNVTAYSDIRVKDNVESIEGAIGKLNQIRGVTYTRTDLDDKHRRFAGVIAQEIEQVLPEAVFDNGRVKAVDYNATIALLIEAVKEQQGQINELKLTIEQLKGN